MYNTNYSRAKFGLESREPLHRSNSKGCGYYMRIIFFFSSLIQSLIIVSLVLFLVYGQPEKTAEEQRTKELELSFNRLSENNVKLRKEKAELGAQLGVRTAEKGALEKEVETLKTAAAASAKEIQGLQEKIAALELEKKQAPTCPPVVKCPTPVQVPFAAPLNNEMKTLESLYNQQRLMVRLIEANFSQTVYYLSTERDAAQQARDECHGESIVLRRENTKLTEQLSTYTRKCKEDFAGSLEGIQVVTRAFLTRIENLFPHQLTFHLSCKNQQEDMEKIKNGCTNLSKEVEDKFQSYLNIVGNTVSDIQGKSSLLEVQNSHLTSDLQECQHNRSTTAAAASKMLQEKQLAHDTRLKGLLDDLSRIRKEKALVEHRLSLREDELHTYTQKMTILREAVANCKPGDSRTAVQPQNKPGSVLAVLNKPPTVR